MLLLITAASLMCSMQLCLASKSSFGPVFDEMKQAYFNDDWSSCSQLGKQALAAYRQYISQVIDCRSRCQSSGQLNANYDYVLKSFGQSIHQITCISSCRKLRNVAAVDKKYISAFEEREPYDFLQLCYYKQKMLEKAAAAATTFMVVNPAHSYMAKNIDAYRNTLKVPPEFFVDLEAGDYQKSYKNGVVAYRGDKWDELVVSMTTALHQFVDAVSICSIHCEEGLDTAERRDEVKRELVGIIADHIVSSVKCKSLCESRLSQIDMAVVGDLFSQILFHLHYGFYKLKDYRNSSVYAAAYLMFQPESEVMQRNKEALLTDHNALDDWFKPPEEVVVFKNQQDELRNMINYIEKEFVNELSESTAAVRRMENMKELFGDTAQIVMNETVLGGKERIVVDGFATQAECYHLADLCRVHGTSGDGYESAHPHTMHELFTGITVEHAHELVKDGTLAPNSLRMYLDLTENTRKFTQLFFHLPELYFDYTHLVCRTSVGTDEERTDLSHEVHADNCVIQADGSCYKGKPAYVQRDYSALLYLTDDFEGGEFFFADNHKHEQAVVKPKSGRLVAFHAGSYHGVKAVTKGRRCALAIWFTLDAKFSEKERLEAKETLHQLDPVGKSIRDEL